LKRRIDATVILVFLVIFAITGVAYAALSGNLQLGGTASVASSLDLDLGIPAEYNTWGNRVPYEISGNGDTITFDIDFSAARTFHIPFTIENVGSVSAVISTTGTITSDFPPNTVNIKTSFNDNAYQLPITIAPGETRDNEAIDITWINDTEIPGGDYTFSVTIPYTQAD
jgi:hypothetical protein